MSFVILSAGLGTKSLAWNVGSILWTMIALGALAICRFDWHRQERHSGPKPLQEWTAFVCALR